MSPSSTDEQFEAHRDGEPIPDYLPGEPVKRAWSAGAIALELGKRALVLALLLSAALPFAALYLVARLFTERPPCAPAGARYLRCLGLIFTEPVSPPLPAWVKACLALRVLQRWCLAPVWAVAWWVDALLYGRALGRVRVVEPLFELSAARSGSTQLAHYLEDDPRICVPTVAMAAVPFLWLWKLMPVTLGRLVSVERARRAFLDSLPRPYLQRHEMDPFRTDTFEMVFFAGYHLGDILIGLGPRVMCEEFNPAVFAPSIRPTWEGDFVDFLDAVGRKTLLHAARGADPSSKRLMIKGHFLGVGPALERRYPDARFLAVVRPPSKRLQSVVNYHRCPIIDPVIEHLPWPWLVRYVLRVEVDYCDAELEFYQRAGGARRTVIRFDDYVRDLEGTLRRVYRECLDLEALPPELPLTHADRVRTHYSFDRSLAQLGIDVGALDQRLGAYNRWCRQRPA